MLTLTLLALSGAPRAFADTCTWNGKNSNYWSDPGNWDACPNGVPGPMDDVVIPGFTPPRLSSVDGSYTIGNLSLQGGYLTVFSTATLNGGTLTASGSSTVQNFNVINMNVIVSDGTLSTNGGTFNGPLTIGLFATLRVVGGGANFTDNVTVNGTLADNNTGQTFAFGGSQFANNGTVSVPNLNFNRSGTQTLSGFGAWTGSGTFYIAPGSTTALANDMTMQTNVTVGGGGTLALLNHALTLNGTQSFNTMCTGAGHVTGSGAFHTQGNVSLTNCGTFQPPVEITSGTATVNGVYSGTLTILNGATDNAGTQTVLGDVSVSGTLAGTTFVFDGTTFSNNGSVTTAVVNFASTGQTLTGSGYFVNNTVQVLANASVGLGSDQRLSKLNVGTLGTLNLNAHTLTLTGGGAPLAASGTLNTMGSNIVYAGTTTQTIAYFNINYFGLTISNSVAAIAPMQNVNVAGDFSNTSGFQHGNGTLNFVGSATQTVRGLATTFANVIISNTMGVSLTTSASITGALTLNGDLFTGANVLTQSGTSSGDGDVFGNVKRSGFALGTAYSFGSPYVSVAFTSGTPPTDIALTLSKGAPSDLNFAVQRTYAVTPTGGSGYVATLRLHYRDGELPSAGELPLQVWRRDDALARWSVQPKTAANTTQNWLARSGVTSFSRWALAVGNAVFLPMSIR